MKKILILSPYPYGTAGSQRFRYEQYTDLLIVKGYSVKHQAFLDKSTWNILYKQGNGYLKILGLIKGFFRRFKILFASRKYDFILIHREVTPIGPPFIEWTLAKILRKKLIFDFDDAIWLENTSGSNLIASMIKYPQKTGLICRWSYKISAGNLYLSDYAKQFNNHVIINPTTIDTEDLHYPTPYGNAKIVVGWTGTHSTLKYLHMIKEVLLDLQTQFDFSIHIIADQSPYDFIDNYTFVPWSKTSEINDLNQIDIGLMPLTDDKWSKGKCGFKALQYMALEKPVIASPVGVNTGIIENGINGFLCTTKEEWKKALINLLTDDQLRMDMGKRGREKVESNYSVKSNNINFLSLFN